ncbi:MAG TPA: hypothetical protein VLI05_00680 [Candidatus Saccharimonadia bacterium]|nr:hypothetical protein [Candidatus Saccharimonadia bacterium]
MYSGFVLPHKTVSRLGIHQRFDMAAYRMIEPLLPVEAFPSSKDIVYFEGYNGPDGLKVKSPGVNEPSHLYDPGTDTGDVPRHIANHYRVLVETLQAGDLVRAAFEASWMAHYIGDGLTPAHHWPLEAKLAEAAALVPQAMKDGDTSKFAAIIKKHWAVWGAKGHMSTHFNFEMGVAFAMLIFPIRPVFSEDELAQAQRLGPVEYFKTQAREVAALNLYDKFYKQGWTADIATTVKNTIAPQAARTIGIIWLLAAREAS